MANDQDNGAKAKLAEQLRGTRDALTVKRVFGDAYERDGVTIIPVAQVAGGGGGGGGESHPSDGADTKTEKKSESGFGSGFGIGARPIGVYEVRDGDVRWNPTVDVTRLARGGQVLAGIIAVCVTLVLVTRRLTDDG